MATGTGVKTMKFNIGGNAANREPGVKEYAGKVPRDGSYRVKLKFALIIKNSNGDPMITGLAEINEKKGSSQAQYNGYGIWFQQNITDQGAGYVNSLLEAWTDGSETAKQEIKEAFWEEGPKVKQGDKPFKGQPAMHIKRIGDVVINSPESKIEFIIVGKYENKSYGEQLRAQGYAPLAVVEGQFGGDDSDDEDDEDEAPVTVAKKAPVKKKPVKKAPVADDEDDDEVSSEPTDYDEDEEPEKVAKAKAKKAAETEEADDDEDEDQDDTSDDDDETEPPF